MNEPAETYLLDSYRFAWKDEGVDVLVDRLHEEKDGLKCELTVSSSRPPKQGLLREGNFNLSSATTRSAWVKELNGRQDGVDWYAVMEVVCAKTRRRWRDGEPVVDLAKVTVRPELPYLAHPLVVEGASSVLFADGGSGKSLIALAVGVSIATGHEIIPGIVPMRCGPVLYWDWEWGDESHAERLQAICSGAGLDVPEGLIFYQHETASVLEAAPRMRRRVAETGAIFVIIDSLGFARGGDANSQELTTRMFTAFSTFSVPVLAIDHVARQNEDAKKPTHSFGSAYTYNSARLMWRLDAAKEEGRDDFWLALVNTKTNRKFHKPRGLKVNVESDASERLISVTFEATDVELIPGLNTALPLRTQIEGVLRANNGILLTPKNIADVLEAEGHKVSEAAVRTTLNRNKSSFVRVGGGWGLIAREVSA